jgi:hypothetical protein
MPSRPTDTDFGLFSTAAVNTPSGRFTLTRRPVLPALAHVWTEKVSPGAAKASDG